MSDQTTTTSLRERAIAAADQTDRDVERRHQREHEDRKRRVLDRATTRATRLFGESAHGVEWEYGFDRAVATIDGERFEFSSSRQLSGQETLRHLMPCPDLRHPPADMRSNEIHSLYELGELLRGTAADGGYSCGACESRRYDEQEAALAAKVQTPPESPLAPLPSARRALEMAAQFAGWASDYFANGEEGTTQASAAALVSRAYSELYHVLDSADHADPDTF